MPFEGVPGPLNSTTNVKGVEVGYSTVIKGSGKLEVGQDGSNGDFFARHKKHDPVYAGWFSLNGNGEMTGTAWIDQSGFLEGPVLITNTHSVGVVHEAVIHWQVVNEGMDRQWSLPVVAETWDGYLNDINGFHVRYPPCRGGHRKRAGRGH